MTYSVLSKLRSEGSLQKCSILVSDDILPRKAGRIFGRDITSVSLSRIEFRGGETGHEKLSVPMNSVLEIEREGRVIYRKKKRIVRIYPR